MGEDISVVGGQRLEFVGGAGEGRFGDFGDMPGKRPRETRLRIESGTDRSAALRQRIEVPDRHAQPRDAALDLRGVAGKFLAERQRRRILGVGAADLDDMGERRFFFAKRAVKRLERGNEIRRHSHRGRDVHCGRERVVRRLAHIDVIVGMNRCLGAELAAQQFVGAVGDHLVEVHVGLRAGAGLPDHQRKVIVELAVDHLLRGADDGAGAALVEQGEFAIGFRRRELDDAERMNDRHRHPILADTEIPPRPFRLRAPVAIGGNLDRAKAVSLGARRIGSRGCCWSIHESCPLRKDSYVGTSSRQLRGRSFYGGADLSRADYFLRKRFRRTTSAAPPRLVGSSLFSGGGAGTGRAAALEEAAATAGGLAAGASAAASDGSNWRPNCTDGSKKLLMELNGTTRRSAMPPNERPTSNRSSVTVRSQNWCWRMTVISSGYCASNRGDSFTPSAVDRKVMKK